MCQVGDCRQKHHTLMHSKNMKGPSQDTQRLTEQNSTAPTVTMTTTRACRTVLPATARIRLESCTGESVIVRALLDHAAEFSFISEWAAKTLRVKRVRVSIPTSGLQGTATGEVKAQTRVILRSSLEPTFSMPVSALILHSLSNLLPLERVERQYWPHLEGLQLAYPDFIEPGRIDAILGADVYRSIVRGSVRHRSPDEPTAMHTVLGWVVFGPTGPAQSNQRAILVLHYSVDRLSLQLQRFWETEVVSSTVPLSPTDEWCESQFTKTQYHEQNGRYVVRLPINQDNAIRLAIFRRRHILFASSCCFPQSRPGGGGGGQSPSCI